MMQEMNEGQARRRMWWTFAGGLLTVGLVAAVSAAMPEPEAARGEGLFPFSMEATVEVASRAISIGTNVAGEAKGPPDTLSHSTVRWWVADASHYRIEIVARTEGQEARSFLSVANGE